MERRPSLREDEKVLETAVVTVHDNVSTSSHGTAHRKVVAKVNLTSCVCCCNNVCEPIR